MKLPTVCPSCTHALTAHVLVCEECQTKVEGLYELPDILLLSPEEQEFILKFFLFSGSIKDMAKAYKMSYPTMRNKLDDLISKIKSSRIP